MIIIYGNDQTIYTEETIILIKPLKANEVWNDTKYDRIETYNKNGDKIIILRIKE